MIFVRSVELTLCRIGDWYPERNIFQILIAVNSGQYITLECPTTDSDLSPRSPLHPCYVAVLPHPVA
jgi:hypothetical protein